MPCTPFRREIWPYSASARCVRSLPASELRSESPCDDPLRLPRDACDRLLPSTSQSRAPVPRSLPMRSRLPIREIFGLADGAPLEGVTSRRRCDRRALRFHDAWTHFGVPDGLRSISSRERGGVVFLQGRSPLAEPLTRLSRHPRCAGLRDRSPRAHAREWRRDRWSTVP